jgi:hypothetical protein
METFTASDLNRRRRRVLDAGRGDGALVRDADAVLALVPFERLAASERLNQLGATLVALIASLADDAPAAAALGEAGWAASWSAQRRRQLVEDLGEALALATSMHDPRPAEALLDALRPKPDLGARFDAAATWAQLSVADKEFLRGKRRRAR